VKSHAIWDHTVLPATFIPAEAGTLFACISVVQNCRHEVTVK